MLLLPLLLRNEDQVPPYDVAISPELVAKLEDCLNQLNLQPVNLQNASGNEVSLLVREKNTYQFKNEI